MLNFDEFKKLDLRIASILDVKPHPNADRLYVVDIEVGGERKQIVAGIRQHYTPAELIGKKIVVVNNLEPAVIRGVESQGMLLAASNDQQLTILVPEREISSGAVVR
jgi:methionyl-tRNA synthetase